MNYKIVFHTLILLYFFMPYSSLSTYDKNHHVLEYTIFPPSSTIEWYQKYVNTNSAQKFQNYLFTNPYTGNYEKWESVYIFTQFNTELPEIILKPHNRQHFTIIHNYNYLHGVYTINTNAIPPAEWKALDDIVDYRNAIENILSSN